MGEYADYANEYQEETCEHRRNYRQGMMSLQDAYDLGVIGELGQELQTSRRSITCKHCGKSGLHWMKTTEGYRTADNGIVHKCPHFSK